jgi:hypothetical protein
LRTQSYRRRGRELFSRTAGWRRRIRRVTAVSTVAALALLASAQGASADGEAKTVRIYLMSVTAHDTEDVTGRPWPWSTPYDDFYLTGTAFTATPGEADVRSQVRPVNVVRDITKGTTADFGVELFSGTVEPGQEAGVAIKAMDEDAARQAARYGQLARDITTGLEAALAFGGPVVGCEACPAVGKGLKIASNFVEPLVALDKDDHLGDLGRSWSYDELTTHDGEFRFGGSNVPWWSDWDYTVRYRIVVE